MGKKDYKKGMSDAVEAYQGFGEKQEAAIRHVAQETVETAQKVDKLGDNFGAIVDYISDQEKAELYKLNTSVDIAELEDAEKRILLAVLYQLSTDEGDERTEEQQNYIRAVQRYLEITNPQTETDLSVVENIESNRVQKAVLQAVLEFFRLGRNPDIFTKDQEEFLDCFQLNQKTRREIAGYIETIVNATGLTGLAEKYGFVPEPEALKDKDSIKTLCEEEKARRKMAIYSRLYHGTLDSTLWMINYHLNLEANSDYTITVDDDLNALMESLIDPYPELLHAHQSNNMIAAYDTEQGGGANSVYFLYTGLIIINNGNCTEVAYSDITSLDMSMDNLTIICSERTVTIPQSCDIPIAMLRAFRKILMDICSEISSSFVINKEWIIQDIVEAKLHAICNHSICRPHIKPGFKFCEKGLDNALHSYALRVDKNDVLAFIDTSLFSNGKDGLLFSKTGIAFDYLFSKVFLRYDEISSTEIVKRELVFHGNFSNLSNPTDTPSISDSWFNLDELKACIDEIFLYA